MPPMINLAGKKFNHLTAIYSVSGPSGRLWYCMCDCGKMKKYPISGYALKSGEIRDCGCIKKPSGMYRHGQSGSKLYKVWSSMKSRCIKESDKAFKDYGGRGISVCEDWKNDYITFYEWAMNNGYQEGLTIERKDNDGDYEPENCSWIPKCEQTSNRRINKLITYKGKTQILKDWAKELGIDYCVIQSRITQLDWDVSKAFETPTIPRGQSHIKLISYEGKTQSIAAWARELNINYKTLHRRISNGKSMDEIIRMIREIKELTGITPKIATPGLEVDLELYPY